jgi:hypothetical protein
MKLQTQIPFKKQSDNLINYASNILLIGSCFVENIGNKLEYFKFQNLLNPFGILFHPKAIEVLIADSVGKKKYSEKDIFFYNEQWHSFDAHSKLSNPSKEILLLELNSQLGLTNQKIQKASHVIITLGTAWVYRFVESQNIVANCHKVPQKQFSKELLSVEEIVQSLENMVRLIKKVNPDVAIIFTVSPVRHLKDGFIENTQSKSHLITAIHSILTDHIHYFPSYEIMMDELRDYRFYAEDMMHPNHLAIEYIWNKFKEVWISEDSNKIMDEVDVIQKNLQHKPFNPNSESHQKFLQNLEISKQQLELKLPFIKF